MGLVSTVEQVKSEFFAGLIDTNDASVALQYLGQSSEQANATVDQWQQEQIASEAATEADKDLEIAMELLELLDNEGVARDRAISILERMREMLVDEETADHFIPAATS